MTLRQVPDQGLESGGRDQISRHRRVARRVDDRQPRLDLRAGDVADGRGAGQIGLDAGISGVGAGAQQACQPRPAQIGVQHHHVQPDIGHDARQPDHRGRGARAPIGAGQQHDPGRLGARVLYQAEAQQAQPLGIARRRRAAKMPRLPRPRRAAQPQPGQRRQHRQPGDPRQLGRAADAAVHRRADQRRRDPQHRTQHQRHRHHQLFPRPRRRQRGLGSADHAGIGALEFKLLGGFLKPRQKALIDLTHGACRPLELAQPHARAQQFDLQLLSGGDIGQDRGLAPLGLRLGGGEFVHGRPDRGRAVAQHILQRHLHRPHVRVLRPQPARQLRALPFQFGQFGVQIGQPRGGQDRGRILGALGVQHLADIGQTRGGGGAVASRDDHGVVHLRQLLADALFVAAFLAHLLGHEIDDRILGIAQLGLKLDQAPVQPVDHAPGRDQLGLELVADILVCDGIGDIGGGLGILGPHRDRDDIGNAALEHGQVPAHLPDHQIARILFAHPTRFGRVGHRLGRGGPQADRA